MMRFFARFIRHQQGVALIEFVIVFPFMFLLLFGGIELSRYIIITQNVERAAYAITDITGQFPSPTTTGATGELSVTQLDTNVFPQFHRMMGRFGDTTRERVIMTSVEKRGNNVYSRV
jgi:Flp pilus assembly protein TadG